MADTLLVFYVAASQNENMRNIEQKKPKKVSKFTKFIVLTKYHIFLDISLRGSLKISNFDLSGSKQQLQQVQWELWPESGKCSERGQKGAELR